MKFVSTMSTRSWLVIALASAGALMVGCEASEEGEEGNFNFVYADSLFVSSTDLAEGAMARVRVEDAQEDRPVMLREVFSEDEDTLSIADIGDDDFVMEARASGETRVTAESADDDLSDSFRVRSAEVAGLSFDSRCSSNTFVAGAGARFRYEMSDSAGDALTGYGQYPVTVEADDIDQSLLDGTLDELTQEELGQVNHDHQRLGSLEIATGAYPGTYVLQSEVDDEQYAFDVVAAEDLTNLDNVSGDEDGINSRVTAGEGPEEALGFRVEADLDEYVCGPLDGVIEVTSDDPDVCEASYAVGLGDWEIMDLHLIMVEGLEVGECGVTVEVPDADLGLEMSVTVE